MTIEDSGFAKDKSFQPLIFKKFEDSSSSLLDQTLYNKVNELKLESKTVFPFLAKSKNEGRNRQVKRSKASDLVFQDSLSSGIPFSAFGRKEDGNRPEKNNKSLKTASQLIGYSKIQELKLVKIGLASPNKIVQWAEKVLPNGKIFGEVLNANTLHYKTFKPQKGGLFCERIFGPLKDFECACGLKKKPFEEDSDAKNFLHVRPKKRLFCSICDVEYTWSVIRRYQLGYIKLASPVSHLWYLRTNPSYLSLMLDVKKRDLEAIVYCMQTTTLEYYWKPIHSFQTNLTATNVIESYKTLSQQNFKISIPELSQEASKQLTDKKLHKKLQKRENFQIVRRKGPTRAAIYQNLSDLEKEPLEMKKRFLEKSFQLSSEPSRIINNNSRIKDFIEIKMSKKKSKKSFFDFQRTFNKETARMLYFLISRKIFLSLYSLNPTFDLNLKARGTEVCSGLWPDRPVAKGRTTTSKKTKKNPLNASLSLRKVLKSALIKKKKTSVHFFQPVLARVQKDLWSEAFRSKIERPHAESSNDFNDFSEKFLKIAKNRYFLNKEIVQISDVNKVENRIQNVAFFHCFRVFVNNLDFEKPWKSVFQNPSKSVHFMYSKFQPFIPPVGLFLFWPSDRRSEAFRPHAEIEAETGLRPLVEGRLSKSKIQDIGFFSSNPEIAKEKISQVLFLYVLMVYQQQKNTILKNAILASIPNKSITQICNAIRIKNMLNPNLVKGINNPLIIYLNRVIDCFSSGVSRMFASTAFNQFLSSQLSQPSVRPLFRPSAEKEKENGNTVLVFSVENSVSANVLDFQDSQLLKTEYSVQKKSKQKNIVIEDSNRRKQFLNQLILQTSKTSAKSKVFTLHKLLKDPNIFRSKLFFWRFQSPKIYSLKNNIYTISYSTGWQKDRDWRLFFYYNTAPMEINDQPIAFYESRFYKGFYSERVFSSSSPIIGAHLLQKLLLEYNSPEMKKMVKQNQNILPKLNRSIRLSKQNAKKKSDLLHLQKLFEKRDQLIRRLKLLRKLEKKNVDPSSTILTFLPVLPPDLRPILKMQNQIAASDLNRFYQRIIYRNERLKKFLKTNTGSFGFEPGFEIKYAQRLLQEAVDNLIQNGKGQVKPETNSRGQPLKSLSEILKGKQGRFRQYLLGKRVDYSGRSVIVVGPKLKIYQCGLPFEMAIELFLPFLIKRVFYYQLARTVVGAKTILKTQKSLTWDLLEEIIQEHPILLNRAPTLHRLGIQAFQPKLIEGRAILLHPLVCPAFNADFDGDQMAVHIPITVEARTEAWKLMLSRNHLISPATGDPMLLPSQDMVLGCYYLTTESPQSSRFHKGRPFAFGTSFYFSNSNQVFAAYQQHRIHLQTPIWIKWNGLVEMEQNLFLPLEIRVHPDGSWSESRTRMKKKFQNNGICQNVFIRTTAGRVLFNNILESCFHNS